jgi:methyl halide transferase
MEKEFWENRYKEKTTGWDIKAVSTPIKEYIDQLSNKELSILVPGCGFGHEVIYLFNQGFKHITALDFARESLSKISEHSSEIKTISEDFFMDSGSYDLIFEQTLFCAIDPTRRDEYAKKCAELLNENGKYVGLLFDREFEGGPPFGGSTQEYQTRFSNYFSSVEISPCYNSIEARKGTEAFIIAKK